MAIHSSILAWRIPWTEEPGRQQSIGLHRVGHDCSDLACTLKTTVVEYNRWHTGLALSEQARRAMDWRRERRWELGELTDRQQQETEGKMQFHSCQTWMECTLASLKLCNLKFFVYRNKINKSTTLNAAVPGATGSTHLRICSPKLACSGSGLKQIHIIHVTRETIGE